MDKISVIMMIVNREREDDYRRILNQTGACAVFSTPGQGTAGASVLEILGLERTEKTVLTAMTTRQTAKRLMERMNSALGINMPGGGIAFSMPVGSVGGSKALKMLAGDNLNKGEVDNMNAQREFPYDLIVAVAQRDASGAVMDAARKAGARGGTIVHAKGTAGEFAEKFYGVTIAAEKELVLIVAKHEMKDVIMKAIMEASAKEATARAAVFSVPVETVEGMAGLAGE